MRVVSLVFLCTRWGRDALLQPLGSAFTVGKRGPPKEGLGQEKHVTVLRFQASLPELRNKFFPKVIHPHFSIIMSPNKVYSMEEIMKLTVEDAQDPE